jgi:hypothetical protein
MGEVVHGGISGLVSKIPYGEKIGLWVPGTMPISLSQLPPSGRLPCLRSMILCVGPGSARPVLAHSGLSFRDVARPRGLASTVTGCAISHRHPQGSLQPRFTAEVDILLGAQSIC